MFAALLHAASKGDEKVKNPLAGLSGARQSTFEWTSLDCPLKLREVSNRRQTEKVAIETGPGMPACGCGLEYVSRCPLSTLWRIVTLCTVDNYAMDTSVTSNNSPSPTTRSRTYSWEKNGSRRAKSQSFEREFKIAVVGPEKWENQVSFFKLMK